MTDKKWGGKREGAGRPKQEKVKKMHSFRLSDEEVKAVKKLLAKMRGKLIILFCLLSLCLSANCETLQAGITYTEETARIEAFKDVYKYCPFKTTEDFKRSIGLKAKINNDDVLGIQEYRTKLFKTIPYKVTAVIYKNAPEYIYYYEKTNNGYKCVVVDFVIKNKNGEPVKAAKYDAKTGKLMSIIFEASDDEEFIYDKDGVLLAHWKGEQGISLENKQKMLRKIMYSVQ